MTGAKNSGKGARMKPFLLACLAIPVLGTLAACSASDAPAPPAMFCPQVAVLAQAKTLTAFLPGRSDVAAQITTAQITGVAGSCTLQQQKNLLEVQFQAGFNASNGPANNGKPLILPYFVAITQGDQIVSKAVYLTALDFDGNASTAQATTKPVKIELPNQKTSVPLAILVGFELTPDQLSYAQSHPAGP
jgi:hypothetical protein